MARIVLIAMACAGLAFPAHAQNATYSMRTVADVEAVCSSEGSPERTACMAWIQGFVTGVQVMRAANGVRPPCLPDGATDDRFREVILNFMRGLPQFRPRLAGPVALTALALRYPCANAG